MQKQNILFFLIIFILAACGGNTPQDEVVSKKDSLITYMKENQPKQAVQAPPEEDISPNADIDSPLEKTQWVLIRIDASGVSYDYEQEEGKTTIMHFDQGRINTRGNCMSLLASYETPEDNKIVVGKFKGDEKYCTGKLGPVQRRLYNLIANAESYQLDGEVLLTIKSGEDQLRLRKK